MESFWQFPGTGNQTAAVGYYLIMIFCCGKGIYDFNRTSYQELGCIRLPSH